MSAFERLPREVRDMIYENCLLYDGLIIPFPSKYERKGFAKPCRLRQDSNFCRLIGKMPGTHALLGHPHIKRSDAETENKPCVALLGVNSVIRDEAACVLVGKNVWGLSLRSHVQDDNYSFWETYAQYFSYVVVTFEARIVDKTRFPDIDKGNMCHLREDREGSDQNNIHHERLSLLRDASKVQRNILLQMNLKSLLFDFWNLYNCTYFCSLKALQNFLECLGPIGPWYKLGQKQGNDSNTKPETEIKVVGPIHEEEKSLLWETWGLKVEGDVDMMWL